MRKALENNLGLQTSMAVSAPVGAKLGFGCPTGTDWKLEVNFAPKSVPRTTTVHVRAVEAADFGCSRSELGIIVSPVVQIRHRTWKKFSKAFSLRIPHRCSSIARLYLYHWPEDQVYCDKVQGAEFTDEECTAHVTGFGLYAVISANALAPDVVYCRLDVGKRWRDSIGKLVTRMNLGTTHSARVTMIPRGCAIEFEGAGPLLPHFCVLNGTLIEKVAAVPTTRLEGCMINSWSGKVKYRGGFTTIDFNIIIQTIATEALPMTMPLFDCNIVLKNSKGHSVVAFENGNHVRMKVTTVQLCILVDMPPPLSAVHYDCTLQGRETLRDIRIWVAKCFAGAKINNDDLDWFAVLRFRGSDGDLIPLNVEQLDPASNHLPKIQLVRVAPQHEREGAETPEDAMTRMSFELVERTRGVVRELASDFVALPASPRTQPSLSDSSWTLSFQEKDRADVENVHSCQYGARHALCWAPPRA